MNTSSHVFAAAVLTLGCIFAVSSTAQTSSPTAVVTVLSDRYVIGERVFSDLDSLEMHIREFGAQRLRIQACGSAAIPLWKAVVYRFHDLPLDPRVLDAKERECSQRPAA